MDKPDCKLPDVMIASHLIGLTVNALRKAGQNKSKEAFISEIREDLVHMDYSTILEKASTYVQFHD